MLYHLALRVFGQALYNTIAVPNFDDYAKKAADAGGVLITDKMAIPGVGYFAYFRDPEGNVLGIMEMREDAK